MSTSTEPSCRLFVLLAREASTAVILRRGPSKRVAIIAWDRTDDTFRVGQWFFGRLYERRCDLSPDGRLFAYFAARYQGELGTWTAISRPPFLTALALWQNGSGWGGGGLFDGPRAFALNQGGSAAVLHDGYRVPKGFTVKSFGPWAGRGEDHPVWHARLLRDGWTRLDGEQEIKHPYGAPVWFEFDPPIRYRRPNPIRPHWWLELRITGIKVKEGPWYRCEHAIGDHHREIPLGPSTWADWDANGDLLMARDGELFRLGVDALASGAPRSLADFTHLEPRRLPPPRGYGWSRT